MVLGGIPLTAVAKSSFRDSPRRYPTTTVHSISTTAPISV